VLTIAGTDPIGGAGIQADLKTFSALRVYGLSVITAVVAQNTHGVRSWRALDPAFVAEQIDAVFDDVAVDAVKIGMVATAGIAEAVAEGLRHHGAAPVVLDPVVAAQRGDALARADAVAALRDTLAPLATLITPNLPEAGLLLDENAPRSAAQMRSAADRLQSRWSGWVLLKGGHLPGARTVDVLRGPGCAAEFAMPRIDTRNDHGTGCTLSAAIAALLPSHPMETAVRRARAYLASALTEGRHFDVGSGRGPVHHLHGLWECRTATIEDDG
jgi:hydroxymethylpyrimidine/phosphomethylpyrimidine kinase